MATRNIGGSVVLTEGACPALGVQPSRDVVSLMLEEPAALFLLDVNRFLELAR